MISKLTAFKALAAAFATAAVIFNRGNADVATIAVFIFAVGVLVAEALSTRQRFLVAGINLVGLVLVLTFSSLMLRLPEAIERFYMLVLIVTFTQLISETVINFSAGWFKRGNMAHSINWVLHLALWAIFIWGSFDSIGMIGVFGAYAGILAVHWGIEATGPKPLKQD